jgi:glycosyltransferase involved in cell wall biosynthesis
MLQMKILLAHNYYQAPGGEDEVFRLEKELLERNDHEVHVVTRSNRELPARTGPKAAANAIWSRDSARKVEKTIAENDIEIAHFHNTHLMLSPAVYGPCKRRGIPVIHTLHNYRLICPGALHYRDGQPSSECLGKTLPVKEIARGC